MRSMLSRLSKLACLLVLTGTAYAASCSGSSPTWTAATCGSTDVAACVTAASNGDTINIAACSATSWTAGISVSKQLKFVGAGGAGLWGDYYGVLLNEPVAAYNVVAATPQVGNTAILDTNNFAATTFNYAQASGGLSTASIAAAFK